jgi:hypothetical protein
MNDENVQFTEAQVAVEDRKMFEDYNFRFRLIMAYRQAFYPPNVSCLLVPNHP